MFLVSVVLLKAWSLALFVYVSIYPLMQLYINLSC